MKTCFKCHKTKPFSEFYRHQYMGDGYLGKCKDCTKADVNKHRAENLGRIQEYDRERGQLPRRKKANRQQYRVRVSTPEGKANEWAKSKAWREQNRLKRAAHILAGNAIKSGRLVKGPCESCGTRRKIHAHHEDYEKPLEVTWLCRDCHGKRHRELNKLKRAQSVP